MILGCAVLQLKISLQLLAHFLRVVVVRPCTLNNLNGLRLLIDRETLTAVSVALFGSLRDGWVLPLVLSDGGQQLSIHRQFLRNLFLWGLDSFFQFLQKVFHFFVFRFPIATK